MRLVPWLVLANAVWSVVCVGLVVAFFGAATFIGLGYLIGEAIFVAGLAWLQWRALDNFDSAH